MVKDPICGMEVDPQQAKFKAVEKGKNIYFCSKHCYDAYTKSMGNPNSAAHQLTLQESVIPIKGMHCASCVATIEKALKKVPGVKAASVNLITQKAQVSHEHIQLEKLHQAIKDAGYETSNEGTEGQVMLSLKVIGMDNPHCISIVDSALEKQKGILSKELLVTEKAAITYDPGLVSKQAITQLIKDVGYDNYEEIAADREKEARETEIKSLKFKTFAAILLSVPLLYLAMAPMLSLPTISSMNYMVVVQFLLTTPIMAVGHEFFTKGIRSVIRAKTANMDTLVAIGTGAAYAYSVIAGISLLSGS